MQFLNAQEKPQAVSQTYRGVWLTSADVARLCRVEVGTVQGWRKDPSVVSHSTMPDGNLEPLELKLGVRELQLYK